MNIVISGLGIIGGSFAKAIRKYTDHYIIGINRSPAPLEAALEQGAIDEIGGDGAVEKADIIILGMFPQASVDFVRRNAERIPKGCIVIDSAGIKSEICPELSSLAKENGFEFVGVHPMAGKEKNGFDASEADLFNGASCIIIPGAASDEAVDRIVKLAEKIGFGRIVFSTPEEHDRMIAFTSQLAHVVSNAYIKSPSAEKHKGFSAGSYKDLTRVAWLKADMWSELFLANRDYLSNEIQGLIDRLTEYREAIDDQDQDRLIELLREGCRRKREIDGR